MAGSAEGTSNMSLDVLAQVAVDCLQIDESTSSIVAQPKSRGRKASKDALRKNVQSMDKLELEDLKRLSDKLLYNLFTELQSDEIKKSFTIFCSLTPGECNHQVSVYGSELKGRYLLVSHLKQHIAELEEKVADDPEFHFEAEPVHIRKKRLEAEKKKKNKRAKVSLPYSNPSAASVRRGRPPSYPQTLLDYATINLGDMIVREEEQSVDMAVEQPAKSLKTIVRKFANKQISVKVRVDKTENDSPNQMSNHEETVVIEPSSADTSFTQPDLGFFSSEQVISTTVTLPVPLSLTCSSTSLVQATTSNIDKEQLIIELLEKGPPFQDHNYTSILGKRKGIETHHFMYSDGAGEVLQLWGEDQICSRTMGRRNGRSPSPGTACKTARPLQSMMSINKTPQPLIIKAETAAPIETLSKAIPEEIVLQELNKLADKLNRKSSPYPPMPKADSKHQARLSDAVLEGAVDSSGEECIPPAAPADLNPFKRGRRGLDNGSENERKNALKYIRELRARHKADPVLVCKICKDKTFTATATLMYHYRSHAGIKPFVCLICNTTFTRQHSLNYHMLIHNNQSRFECKWCSRRFRHPSHFKEHMRRHTGETPFHCLDCPQSFKTRNTYKRHLRTRHGKLLTANGIQQMSLDEIEQMKAMQHYAMATQSTASQQAGTSSTDTDEELESHQEPNPAPYSSPPPTTTSVLVPGLQFQLPCSGGLQVLAVLPASSLSSTQLVLTQDGLFTAKGLASQGGAILTSQGGLIASRGGSIVTTHTGGVVTSQGSLFPSQGGIFAGQVLQGGTIATGSLVSAQAGLLNTHNTAVTNNGSLLTSGQGRLVSNTTTLLPTHSLINFCTQVNGQIQQVLPSQH